MDHKKSFVISKFTNPSGEIVFRVAGWLNGKRVRKNFSTVTEANAERQILDVLRLQADTGISLLRHEPFGHTRSMLPAGADRSKGWLVIALSISH